MSRPIDLELRNRVLEYIKLECLKAGESVSIPLTQIAIAVGESPKNAPKILNTINRLERRGNIKIFRGEGNKPNRYEFVGKSIKRTLGEAKQETKETMDDLSRKLNEVLSEMVSYCSTLSKENIEMNGKIAYLEDTISKMNFFGKTAEGHDVFVVNEVNPSLSVIIENLKNKKEGLSEKEDEVASTTDEETSVNATG